MDDIFKFDNADESTGFLLWKVTNYWQREIRKVLKKYRLTHTQFVVLAGTYYLSQQEESLTQIAISKHIVIDKMMTSNVLRTLEKSGYVLREDHEIDTRAKVVTITEHGIFILKQAVRDVEDFDTRFFSGLDCKNGFNKELIALSPIDS